MQRAKGIFAGASLFLTACIFSGQTFLDTRKWDVEKTKLTTMSYKFMRLCECSPEYFGPFLIEENPSGVTRVRRLSWKIGGYDTLEIVSEIQRFSIESLIQETRQALDRNHASAEIRYHHKYGFPEFVYVDFEAQIADEEYGWEITEFAAVAGD